MASRKDRNNFFSHACISISPEKKERCRRTDGRASSKDRQGKPRTCGVTEVRGPIAPSCPKISLRTFLSLWGNFVDGLKFAGGSRSLLPKAYIGDMTNMAHKHNVYVSTGDWAEHLLML